MEEVLNLKTEDQQIDEERNFKEGMEVSVYKQRDQQIDEETAHRRYGSIYNEQETPTKSSREMNENEMQDAMLKIKFTPKTLHYSVQFQDYQMTLNVKNRF